MPALAWSRVLIPCPQCKQNDSTKQRRGVTRCFRCEIEFQPDVEPPKPLISEEVVEQSHRALLASEETLRYLEEVRKIGRETAREHSLGLMAGEIQFPVSDGERWLYAVHGKPKQPGSSDGKLRFPSGAKAALYPLPVDITKPVLLCAGFWDTLAARSLGMNAYCSTAGEKTFYAEWAKRIVGAPAVGVCYDTDVTGKQGALKVAQALIQEGIHQSRVKILHLPLAQTDGKDLGNWLARGAGKEDLLALWESTESFGTKSTRTPVDPNVYDVELRDSVQPEWTGKWCRFRATVASIASTPWLLPTEVVLDCKQDQAQLCPRCVLREAVVPTDPQPLLTDSIEYLDLIDTSFAKQEPKLRAQLGIPKNCPSVSITPSRSQSVWELRLSEQFRLDSERAQATYHALSLGVDLESNSTYQVTARAMSDPRNQLRVHAIKEAKPSEDDLGAFEYDPKKTRALRRKGKTNIGKQLKILLDDASLITGIVDRPDLHLLYLLAYHSPLWLQWEERRPVKGWLDVLVVGDSGLGKTVAAKELLEWTGLGSYMDMKKVTAAGLLGGRVEERGRTWIRWGEDSRHDRRLIFYDELKGTSVNTIAVLTSSRSEGIATIAMVDGKVQTHARTRRVWMSNPRSPDAATPVTMGNYGTPCLAIPRLMGSLEDVRRLDAALILLDDEVLQSRREEEAEKRRVSGVSEPKILVRETLHHSILRAWTMPPVKLTVEVKKTCMESASYLVKRYDSDIPLVSKGDMSEKIARLAASLANFLVEDLTPEHVVFVSSWLDRVYSSPNFGYLIYAETQRHRKEVIGAGEVRSLLEANFPDPRSFYKLLLSRPILPSSSFREFFPDRYTADIVLAKLIHANAFRDGGRGYVKSEGFNELLQQWLKEEA